MDDPGRDRNVGARAAALPLATHKELDLALEHIKRVRMVVMGMRIDALPARLERLHRLRVWQLTEDACAAKPPPIGNRSPSPGPNAKDDSMASIMTCLECTRTRSLEQGDRRGAAWLGSYFRSRGRLALRPGRHEIRLSRCTRIVLTVCGWGRLSL